MDPISVGLLIAMATGAAGEAGRQLWSGLSSLVRRDPAITAEGPPTGEAELSLFAENPQDEERAQSLIDALTVRAERDVDFRAALSQWHQQAQTLSTGSGETTNTISGGELKGPVLQGRDFSGINFNETRPN